jgi:CheY-like chemotaxis protein
MSLPLPPIHTSVPVLPYSVSLPPPPTIQSFPPSPLIVFAPELPRIRSLPDVPLMRRYLSRAASQEIRADALLREVPIILLTALDHRVSRLQGIEAGADDFISKPFDRSELRARVRPITRLKRYRSLLAECTRFERVVEHADDGYLLVGEAGDVEYANPRARLYLGLAADGDLTTALLPSG